MLRRTAIVSTLAVPAATGMMAVEAVLDAWPAATVKLQTIVMR
jgi:hypothetical protein